MRAWRWIGEKDRMMTSTSEVVSAIRELTSTKQLERAELLDLLKDGLHAALVKRYGPNVRAEIGIDELKGTIRIVVLRTVVETVEDPGARSHHPLPRAEPPRALPSGRHHPRRAQAHRGDAQGPAPHPVARGPLVREGAVQARSAGDPAEHRGDPRHGPRGGEPHQDRRLLAGRLDRPGGRVRGAQGLARAGGREREIGRASCRERG